MRKLIALESECRRCGKDLGIIYVTPAYCPVGKREGDRVMETHHIEILCQECRSELAPGIVDMVQRT